MAQFFSDTRFDFREFDLGEAIAPLPNMDTFYDRPISFSGQQIPGFVGTYQATDALAFFDGWSTLDYADNVLMFTGDNYSFNASGAPTAGTVTGMLAMTTTNAGIMGMAALGISVSGIAVYNAATSVGTADDRALLRQMLRGHDRINGSDDADYMFGAAGNDSLFGNLGNDTLLGDAGNDALFGGAGRDRLYGGVDTARDVFVFSAVTESPNASARDVIYNFTRGVDDISLVAIDANTALSGNQAFGWSGKVAGANDVWYTTSGGNARVFADVNGDARADFSVLLIGVTSLTAGDFLL